MRRCALIAVFFLGLTADAARAQLVKSTTIYNKSDQDVYICILDDPPNIPGGGPTLPLPCADGLFKISPNSSTEWGQDKLVCSLNSPLSKPKDIFFFDSIVAREAFLAHIGATFLIEGLIEALPPGFQQVATVTWWIANRYVPAEQMIPGLLGGIDYPKENEHYVAFWGPDWVVTSGEEPVPEGPPRPPSILAWQYVKATATAIDLITGRECTELCAERGTDCSDDCKDEEQRCTSGCIDESRSCLSDCEDDGVDCRNKCAAARLACRAACDADGGVCRTVCENDREFCRHQALNSLPCRANRDGALCQARLAACEEKFSICRSGCNTLESSCKSACDSVDDSICTGRCDEREQRCGDRCRDDLPKCMDECLDFGKRCDLQCSVNQNACEWLCDRHPDQLAARVLSTGFFSAEIDGIYKTNTVGVRSRMRRDDYSDVRFLWYAAEFNLLLFLKWNDNTIYSINVNRPNVVNALTTGSHWSGTTSGSVLLLDDATADQIEDEVGFFAGPPSSYLVTTNTDGRLYWCSLRPENRGEWFTLPGSSFGNTDYSSTKLTLSNRPGHLYFVDHVNQDLYSGLLRFGPLHHNGWGRIDAGAGNLFSYPFLYLADDSNIWLVLPRHCPPFAERGRKGCRAITSSVLSSGRQSTRALHFLTEPGDTSFSGRLYQVTKLGSLVQIDRDGTAAALWGRGDLANGPPAESAGIKNQTLALGVHTWDLHNEFDVEANSADVFTDPDHDFLHYGATSSDPAVAAAWIVDDDLVVEAKEAGTARITVTATDGKSAPASTGFDVNVDGSTSATNAPPLTTRISGIRPNPFNPSTTIHYELSEPGIVRLEVFDSKGTLVRTLVSGPRPSGRHDLTWNATNDDARRVANGVYFVRLQTNGDSDHKKLVLLK